jgi:hypothetical protein
VLLDVTAELDIMPGMHRVPVTSLQAALSGQYSAREPAPALFGTAVF